MRCQKKSLNKNFFEKIIQEFGLDNLLERFPSQLSGGEIQRVVLARSLMAQPKLLLDEPFSDMDFHLKMKLSDFLKETKERFNLTVIHVTHDPIEAVKLAERIFIIEKGKIQFSGILSELFQTTKKGFISEIAAQLLYLKELIKNAKSRT